MNKWALSATLISLGAVLGLGFEKAGSYFWGAVHVANDKLDRNMPMDFEAARVTELMAAKERELTQYDDKVTEIEWQKSQTARRISEVKDQIEREKKVLARISEILSIKQEVYTVAGRQCTAVQVSTDAKTHLDRAKQLEVALADYNRLSGEQDRAVNAARQNLTEAKGKLVALKTQFQQLQMRNTSAELRLEVAKMVGDLNKSPEVGGELARAKENYERRIALTERAADRALSTSTNSGTIDYIAESNNEDTKAEIDTYLKVISTRPAESQMISTVSQ